MINIEAKTEFHRATTEAQRSLVHNSLLSLEVRLAMVFAYSSMAESGASKEHLAGALAYRDALLNLAEPKDTPATFPQKNLQILDKP